MIVCPKCKNFKNIISESPSWALTKKPYEEIIEIQSHCCDCDVDFYTKHKIGNVLEIYDIEENKKYPFSA